MKSLFLTYILFFSSILFAQKFEYATLLIPDSLKQNANAVVRLHQIDIDIASQRKMTIKTKKAITIFNEKGLETIDAIEFYDKHRSVNDIDATIYDAFGNELKKMRRKDFRDQAAIDGFSVFSDNRLIYLDFTPTQYPFTIVYESEVQTSTTASIPRWYPVSDYFLGIEKSVLNVSFPENLGFRKKEMNFSNYKINKTKETSTQLSYEMKGMTAQKPEVLSPIEGVFPEVMLGLDVFNLEGVDGEAKNWNEFGKWYGDKILEGTIDISDETKAKIIALIGTEKNPIEKAKIIYNYLQEKSRYVSIQVGIGGFKPMYAKDVDRLSYGDCKALSNYTRALLNVVNVPSYDVLLYGDKNKKNINSDFASIQGNHMILCIPNGNENVFLECTSQTDPFGYQAGFTDDRDVLIIKPEGGEIVRTKKYIDKDNSQNSKGNIVIDENGALKGNVSIVSEGSQYGNKARVENVLPAEKEAFYKEYLDNISNLKLEKISFNNDKQKIIFTENIEISAENYAKPSVNNLIFEVNVFNKNKSNLKRIRNRKTPFEIQRGYIDNDEIEIQIPQGFSIETLPQKMTLSSKFGDYSAEIKKKDDKNFLYKRSFFVKKGLYKNTEYEEYRLFMEQVTRNDNAKIIITKNQ